MIRTILGLIALLVLMGYGCASSPPSYPGTVRLINKNEGAFANSVLFRGGYSSKEDLYAINPDGSGLMWAKQPLKEFEIGSAWASDFYASKRLDLIPNARYTLYVLWTRFDGRMLDESVISFRAYIDPRRCCHEDTLGIQTCASEIVYLPRVNTNRVKRFKLYKTFDLGDWIKALIGLP